MSNQRFFESSGAIGFAKISNGATATTCLVTGQAGKKIRVINYTMLAANTCSVTFKTHTTALTGAMPLGANGGAAPNYSPAGHFETVAGQGLRMTNSQARLVAGHVTYQVVD